MEAATTRTFKCVPYDANWSIAGTRYDLKAIYRRPRRGTDEFDQVTNATNAEGQPLWDLTSPLPMRRHSDWIAKGFEYVTLADMDSLQKAAPSLQAKGLRIHDFIQHPQLGPWNPKLYAATADATDKTQFQELLALVQQFGVVAVEQIRGQALPEALKQQLAAQAATPAAAVSEPAPVAAPPENLLDAAVRKVKPNAKGAKKATPAAAGVDA